MIKHAASAILKSDTGTLKLGTFKLEFDLCNSVRYDLAKASPILSKVLYALPKGTIGIDFIGITTIEGIRFLILIQLTIRDDNRSKCYIAARLVINSRGGKVQH